MYIGEAYKITSSYDGSFVGYIHRSCFVKRHPNVLKEAGF